jgi:hypothetical protein
MYDGEGKEIVESEHFSSQQESSRTLRCLMKILIHSLKKEEKIIGSEISNKLHKNT